MKKYLWITILIAAAMIAASCGDTEPEPVEETTDVTETETVEEVETETEEAETTEAVTEEVTEEVVEEEQGIATAALPEPWPADFPIPDCFEVISNEPDGNGDQVLVAAVPEGTERPGVWDLGYYFRDEIEGWGVAEENNWDCMLSAFDFKVPLTQGNTHIFVYGWFDTGNIMTVELLLTKDAE